MDKKYGKVVKFMVLSLISGLLLSSCVPGLPTRFIGDDGPTTEEKFEKIITAIELKNSKELKSMFSKNALQKAKDIDANMRYIFELFQVEVQSWEIKGPSTEENIRSGEKRKKLTVWFDIKTNKENYVIFFINYPVDDFDSDNIGLYSLALMTKKEWDALESWETVSIPGVYKPEEE
jgi:hypothetical protein